MIRRAWMFAVSLLVWTPLLTAQEQQIVSNRPSPDESVAARQLVVWSWVQKPQPMPQPLPAPGNLPPAQGLSQSGNPQGQPQGATQSFVGKILREGDRFVLRTSEGASYPLSQRDDPRPYEGKNVQISSTLDPDNTIHIVKVELL